MANNRSDDSRLPHWLVWLAGAVTLLAATMLLLAVVLGVRAGQQQLEIQTRQQVGIHLQRAIDLRTEGNLPGSLAEYQQVLVLDPSNAGAIQGIESLLQIAAGGQSTTIQPGGAAQAAAISGSVESPLTEPLAQAATASAPISEAAPAATPLPTATAKPIGSPAFALWEEAQALYADGDWAGAAEVLLDLEAAEAGYGGSRAEDLLFNSYVNLAAESDQNGNLEEALAYVDQALAVQPDSLPLRKARTMAATYLEMRSYLGKDWEEAISLLEELYAEDVGYRDVEKQLQGAYVANGDALAEQNAWCGALDQYLAAIELDVTPGLFEKRNEARRLCPLSDAVARTAPTRPARTAPTVTPTPRVGAPKATALPPQAVAARDDTSSALTAVGHPCKQRPPARLIDEGPESAATPTEEPLAEEVPANVRHAAGRPHPLCGNQCR